MKMTAGKTRRLSAREGFDSSHSYLSPKIKKRLKKDFILHHKTPHKGFPSEELFKEMFDHASVGIAQVTVDGKWLMVNNKFCDIVGWPKKELFKMSFADITHPHDLREQSAHIKEVLQGKKSTYTIEKRYIQKDKSERWVRMTATLIHQRQTSEPKYVVLIIQDIHDEKNLMTNLELLAESGRVLAGSLDYTETLATVANLLVPQFADLCFIDLLNDKQEYERVKIARAPFVDKKLAEEFYKYPPMNKNKTFIERAICSGKTKLVSAVELRTLSKYIQNASHLRLLKKFHPQSILVVPLIARGKTIGALSFLSQKQRRYTDINITLAQGFAVRIALAVDNARLYRKAQDAVQLRDEFLSIASHEMKTPLTSIKGFTQIIEKKLGKELDSGSRALLSRIDWQIERLTKLVSDLLDIGQITSEKMILETSPVDVNALVADTVAICQQMTHQAIQVKGVIHKKVYLDNHRIMQVLSNLLINAIKYSSDADKILVELIEKEEEIVIAVKDFGMGIAKDKIPHVFERFFRTDAVQQKKISGLGLGLYISNEIVERHGGKIWVKSIVNKGSTFYVSLPAKKSKRTVA